MKRGVEERASHPCDHQKVGMCCTQRLQSVHTERLRHHLRGHRKGRNGLHTPFSRQHNVCYGDGNGVA